MDLDRYATEARNTRAELTELLLQFGIDHIADRCRSVGMEAALRHQSENGSACFEFLRATPAQRKTLLRKMPADDQVLFLISALYHARSATCLLEAVCQYGVVAGPSYRMITAQAATAAAAMRSDWPSLWPFDDDRDPFGEGFF